MSMEISSINSYNNHINAVHGVLHRSRKDSCRKVV